MISPSLAFAHRFAQVAKEEDTAGEEVIAQTARPKPQTGIPLGLATYLEHDELMSIEKVRHCRACSPAAAMQTHRHLARSPAACTCYAHHTTHARARTHVARHTTTRR